MYWIVHLKDIMTKEVVTVTPETPIVDAVRIFDTFKFNGIPVVESSTNKKLVGILTQYDWIQKMASAYAGDGRASKGEKSGMTKTMRKLLDLLVKDVMNPDAVALSEDATLEEATKIFTEHHRVSSIPIVNRDNVVMGMVSRFDVLRAFEDLRSRPSA